MIKQSNLWQYDKVRHEYVPTRTYLINMLPYQESELDARIENLEKWVRRYSRRVYQYIYKNNTNNSKQFIHYKIALNKENERDAILEAISEYLMGAIEAESDLNPFHGEKTDITETIEDILLPSGLLANSYYHGDLPDYGDY